MFSFHIILQGDAETLVLEDLEYLDCVTLKIYRISSIATIVVHSQFIDLIQEIQFQVTKRGEF